MEIQNAKISKATISMADHGCLTFWVYLDGAGWDDFTAESGDGLVAMMRIMDVVGVEKWEDLQGKYVRCKVKDWGDTVDEIGHIMHDKWFNIREFFAERKTKNDRQ